MAGVDQKIGMMDGAYFVGRKDILDWINGQLNMSLGKIEQTASGAVACQMLDVMYPGKVPMHKVNFEAKHEHEFIKNYKVLQNCFTKLKIDRHIEVDKLVRAKYQDNLEFMQWFKRFFELNMGDGNADYDANAARAKSKGGARVQGGGAKPVRRASAAEKKAKAKEEPVGEKENVSNNGKAARKPARATASSRSGGQASAEAKKKINELETVNSELKLTVDGLEKERDFYFGKLRDIEIMLQSVQTEAGEAAEGEESNMDNTIQRIFKILYACDDDNDFAPEDAADAETMDAVPEETAVQN